MSVTSAPGGAAGRVARICASRPRLVVEVAEGQAVAGHGLPAIAADGGADKVAGQEPESGVDLGGGGVVPQPRQEPQRRDHRPEPVSERRHHRLLGGPEPGQHLRRDDVGRPHPHRHLPRRAQHLFGPTGVGQCGEPVGQPLGPGLHRNRRQEDPTERRQRRRPTTSPAFRDRESGLCRPPVRRVRNGEGCRLHAVAGRHNSARAVETATPAGQRQPEVPHERQRREGQRGEAGGAGGGGGEQDPAPDRVGRLDRHVAADAEHHRKEGQHPERQRRPPEAEEPEHDGGGGQTEGQRATSRPPEPATPAGVRRRRCVRRKAIGDGDEGDEPQARQLTADLGAERADEDGSAGDRHARSQTRSCPGGGREIFRPFPGRPAPGGRCRPGRALPGAGRTPRRDGRRARSTGAAAWPAPPGRRTPSG